MHNKKKNLTARIFQTLFYSVISLVGFFIFSGVGFSPIPRAHAAVELIEQAFAPSKGQETIIDLGNTKDMVGNEVLRSSIIGGDNLASYDPSNPANYRAPLIVRITKFLLRLTIVLSISMVIYSGIMYIVEASKGGDVKDATQNLVYIVGGVLLALMSLGIVNLINSFSVSSLTITNNPGCLIQEKLIVSGDPLKEYVCTHSFYGKRYGDRVGDRCRVDYYRTNSGGNFSDGHRAPITDTEQASKCVELGGEWKK